MTVLRRVLGYAVDDNPTRIDRDVGWAFLSTHAYWGRWRDRDTVEGQIAGAWRIVGAYVESSGATVGFARAVSDGFALAYLADLFVESAHRGHGLGNALVSAMIEDGPGGDFRWMLHKDDAHSLYARFGFEPPDRTYLERPSRLHREIG